MKHIAVILTLFASTAQAAPMPEQNLQNMVAQATQVMDAGLCAVANDPGPRSTDLITVLLPGGGFLRYTKADDFWIRGVGYQRNSAGQYLMIERFVVACRKDESAGPCVAARAYWKQVSPAVSPPGSADKGPR